jgi:pimeloyl-ACP methyl ester carboxylesterase
MASSASTPPRQKMSDLIILIPGIMGSVLERDGNQVWGLNRATVIRNLLSLGGQVKTLSLPEGIGDEEPKDGVTATALMPSVHMVPGLSKIDGYSELAADLRSRFELIPSEDGAAGNFMAFPYDWRLSNARNGRRLAAVVEPRLENWRRAGNPGAKLVLICHSMGGLVARWFLEVLGGREVTRKLITIGTPFRGSVNALDSLANGFARGLGPLEIRLDELLRSFPSVHQLLPTYPCIEESGGTLRLAEVAVPNIAAQNIAAAAAFHQAVADRISSTAAYRIFAIKGIAQPTLASARLKAAGVEVLHTYLGEDKGGDGTVPRPSSHPPEWEDDLNSIFFAQQHGSLQNSKDCFRQIFGLLTDNLGRFMGGAQIGLDIPDVIRAEDALPVTALAPPGGLPLPLQAHLLHENGRRSGPQLMRSTGESIHSTSFDDLEPGAYRVTVSSASPAARPVEPVTGLTLVWRDEP